VLLDRRLRQVQEPGYLGVAQALDDQFQDLSSTGRELPSKTLWDWLDLLIIPVVLGIGGYLFTRSENTRVRAAAARRAQDDTLQAYIDGMSQMLTDKDRPLHKAQRGNSLSSIARARTLMVLTRLDSARKRIVLEF
jgi:hypothetical protein